ncbi:MAG: formylglycine-generating enzyme family protein [Proteobacteria bacterium]|nr:formylglycine-generating enzyme family protein [Pseudomonadota bacterium]MBU1710676.1 formylglycine-generating enzyme family protein [Pseudomonadota bacterium]
MKSLLQHKWLTSFISILFVVVLFIALPVSAKDTLAVLDPVIHEGIEKGIVQELVAAIEDEVNNANLYDLLSNEEKIQRAKKVPGNQTQGCEDTQCMIDAGKILGVKYVIGGALVREKGDCYIKLRLIEISGEGMGVKRSASKKCSPEKEELLTTTRMITSMFMGKSWGDVVKEFGKEKKIIAEPPHDGIWREPETGMPFVWVEGGCFEMGCGKWTDNCEEDESPAHEVCVDGFWMGKYEVTQGQWQQIIGENPSRFQKGDDYPVEQVSWNDVQEFIVALNAYDNSKNIFRLPTEAEWEFAARSGGRNEKFSGGADVNKVGWGKKNSADETRPVGKMAANGAGLHDMSGNIYEWCMDWYDKEYYQNSPPKNPKGPGNGKKKVIRGGSLDSKLENLRVSNRGRSSPTCPNYTIGFRLVWSSNSM